MAHGWGTIRTTEGEITVDDDAIQIHKSPRKFLRGQLSRWQDGSRWQQLKAVVGIGGLLLVPFFIVARLTSFSGMSIEWVVYFSFVLILFNILPFWLRHFRGTRIPLSAIEDATLDTGERRLTITHDVGSGLPVRNSDVDRRWFPSDDPFSLFAKGEVNTELILRTVDDVREARTVFRTRGITDDLEAPKSGEPETKYRVDTKGGVVFCEQCGSQVSPSDKTCPACEYLLRVEQQVESGSRELAKEQPE